MGLCTNSLRNHLILIASLLMLCASGGCKPGPWPLWDAYSAHFIDGQGRVIDHQAGDRTTSEGQAYALFFALVDNDRATFDRLLNWTQANLANGDLRAHLPAWLWGKNDKGEWKTLDPNSASDADVWIAYSLLEAGRLWKVPLYTGLGRQMMVLIAKSEVAGLPGFGPMLMPGPIGFQHGRVWTLNPSYMPLFLFERLALVDPAGPWRQIALGIPRMLAGSARHGFAMDWVDYAPGDGFYPTSELHPGNEDSNKNSNKNSNKDDKKETEAQGGSYDAIRVYLWAGMTDSKDERRAALLNAVPAMSAYLVDHGSPPEKISSQGVPLAQDGPVGFSAAVLPYLNAFPGLSNLSDRQTLRMNAQKDQSSGLYGKDLAYYDQNLILFSTGYLDGRFRFGVNGEVRVKWTRR
jgi:endoglucanase